MKRIFYKRSALILAMALVFTGAPALANDVGKQCEKNLTNEDYKNALAPCQEAAEQGHLESQIYLALMYYKGEGVKQDYLEAVKWWRRGAKHGHEYRGMNIATIAILRIDYSSENLKQDYLEAVEQWRQAAEQGDINAQFILGFIYSTGNNGIERDNVEAAQWWRRAAMQGEALAQAALASMLYYGEQNKQEAYIWLVLTVEQGYGYHFESTKGLRDKIGKELSAGELAQAQNEIKRRRAEIEERKEQSKPY